MESFFAGIIVLLIPAVIAVIVTELREKKKPKMTG